MALKLVSMLRSAAKNVPAKRRLAPPDLDWEYISLLFIEKFYNKPEEPYGHWITPEMWQHLNPYGHVRSQGYFHPSSGLSWKTTGCVRNVIFDLLCAPRSDQAIKASLARILDNGTNRHIGLQVLFLGMAHFRWMGVEAYEAEHRVCHPVLPIEGNTDGKLTFGGGHQVLLDFKTISTLQFQSLKKPKDKHTAQLSTYLDLDNVHTGYVLYEDKNSQEWGLPFSSFAVRATDGAAERDDYCREVLEMSNAYELPEFNKKICAKGIEFCAYRDICDQSREAEDDASFLEEFADKRSPVTKKKHLKVFQ